MIVGYKTGYKFRVQSTRDSQNKEIKHKLFGERFSRRTNKDKADKNRYYLFLCQTFLKYVWNYLCNLTFRTMSVSNWIQTKWQENIIANQNNTFICELDDNTEVEVLNYNNGAVIVKVTGTDIVGILG